MKIRVEITEVKQYNWKHSFLVSFDAKYEEDGIEFRLKDCVELEENEGEAALKKKIWERIQAEYKLKKSKKVAIENFQGKVYTDSDFTIPAVCQ